MIAHTDDSFHVERRRFTWHWSDSGHSPTRTCVRRSATRLKIRPSRPGRAEWVFPRSFSPARQRSWGFKSSFSALRRFAPASGWMMHLCTSRAHVSVVVAPTTRGPIYFRRADPPALARVSNKGEFKRARLADRGCRGFAGLLGFNSRLRSVSATLACAPLCRPRHSERPRVVPALGFRLFQVCRNSVDGSFDTAVDLHRSRLEPRSIISLREAGALSRRTAWDSSHTPRFAGLAIRSWAWAILPAVMTHRRAAVEEKCAPHRPCAARPKPCGACRLPFSVLKGLTPCPLRPIRVPIGATQPV